MAKIRHGILIFHSKKEGKIKENRSFIYKQKINIIKLSNDLEPYYFPLTNTRQEHTVISPITVVLLLMLPMAN